MAGFQVLDKVKTKKAGRAGDYDAHVSVVSTVDSESTAERSLVVFVCV